MKRLLLCPLMLVALVPTTFAQKRWTETDRAYLVENMKRTRDELVRETENLTTAQWNFRESPERWTIAEITEHLALWEVIFGRETNIALRSTPEPGLNQTARPDAYYLDYIFEEKAHVSPDFSRPSGFIRDGDNLTFFRRTREQTIRFLETTDADLRSHFEPTGGGQMRNVHQVYIVQWGHVDRHLRQIRKVKAHPAYPKGGTAAVGK